MCGFFAIFVGLPILVPYFSLKCTLGALHKLRHFKIDLYGSSNNDHKQ